MHFHYICSIHLWFKSFCRFIDLSVLFSHYQGLVLVQSRSGFWQNVDLARFKAQSRLQASLQCSDMSLHSLNSDYFSLVFALCVIFLNELRSSCIEN